METLSSYSGADKSHRKRQKTYGGNNASREKILKIQQDRLKKLVHYARNNSPYYKKLFAGIPSPSTLFNSVCAIEIRFVW